METIFGMIQGLLKAADWNAILAILAQTIETLKRMFGLA